MPKKTILTLLLIVIITACQPVPATAEPELPTTTPEPVTASPVPTQEKVEIIYNAITGGQDHASWERSNAVVFMENNPGISIDLRGNTLYSSPVPQGIKSRMEKEAAPDVFSGPMAGLFLDYVEMGLIADITDLWEANGWYDKFPQSVIDMASVDGRQYFVPTMLQFHPIWYNTEVFAQYNVTPPQTWDELLAICDTLSAAGQTPITNSVSGWNAPTARWFTYINLRVNGQEFHTALMHGKVSWLDERVRTVFEYWQEMFDHHCFSDDVRNTNYRQAANAVANGDAAMYLLGEWLSETYPVGIPENLDHFPVPVIDPAIPPSEIAHQYGAFMHANTQHPEEAKLFLTWLGSVESHNSFGKALHRISTHTDLDQSLFDEKYWRGAEMTANTQLLTSLFELGTDTDVATTGLNVFTSFMRNPDNIDQLLESMESAREKAYGPLP